MNLIWPWMLPSLFLVPLFAALYIQLLRRRRQAASGLGSLGPAQHPSGRDAGQRRHVPPALFLMSLALLLFGMARPEMPVSLPRVEGTVVLAFDVSRSMQADDLEPTRIEAAKAAARAFVEHQPSTIQIGVVAFSNGGLIVQRPTDAQADILAAIDRLSPQGGTSLGQGIFTSLNAIAGEPITAADETLTEGALGEEIPLLEIGNYPSAVIVLLTDGENTGSPEPLEVAQLAAEAGVRIYPVGIGSAEGTVLEVEGFNIVTQLHEPALQAIASLTNGSYYRAEDEGSLKEIYKDIDLQMTIKGERMEVTSVFACLGSLFLLIGGGLSMLWFGRVP